MPKKKVLLIYTELGFSGTYLIQAPISLVYVASQIVHFPEIEVEILDCRVQNDWQDILNNRLTQEDVLLVGFFVMSGLQVAKAYEVTKMVKEIESKVPIVWGGPHPTILAEEVVNDVNIDFCVQGFGIDAMTNLVKKLLAGSNDYETIPNLSFKKDGKSIIGNINATYERVDYKDLPYHLLDHFIEKIFASMEDRTFPIYTAFGCPYLCNFCITPIWFSDSKKKWDPIPAIDVVDHIEYLMEKYAINFIYFWDDDSFVSPSHVSGIAKEIIKRDLNVKIGIRGIRANEVDRLKEQDFDLLSKVGVKYLHIGIENGSQRMLDLMEKGITVEQSISANRKVAKHQKITAMYNMLTGIPSETMEDLRETGKFILQVTEENPNCIVNPPNKLIPYPGGEAYEIAVKHGYTPPKRPEDWNDLDQEAEVYFPWYTPQYDQFIRMLQVVTYALSNWERYLVNHAKWIQIIYKVFKGVYKPIAKFRIKNANAKFLIEYPIMRFGERMMERLAPSKNS